jgi:SAM-dependent methyltransferase
VLDAQYWDERYSSSERLFSGRPNGVLVAEATGLPPGRALDAGAGEGADAIWLAEQGWQVTAVDVSKVALDRAARAAEERGVAERIRWHRADLTQDPPPPAAFDLVSAQYLPLERAHGPAVPRGLIAAVAPGGTLLVVGHDPTRLPADLLRRFDPAGYYWPGDVAALLGDDWTVLADETRPRDPAPPGSPHTHDTVLLARRPR